jgi:creatinine amidohydrolase
MLVLAPHLVDTARAEASPALNPETPGPLTRSDTTSPNYSRSGSFGDPTLATRAKGKILLAAMLDDMVDQATVFLGAKSGAAGGIPRSMQR